MIENGFEFLAKKCMDDIKEVLLIDLAALSDLRRPILGDFISILVLGPESFHRYFRVVTYINCPQDRLGDQLLRAIQDAPYPLLVQLVLGRTVQLSTSKVNEDQTKNKKKNPSNIKG